MYSELLKIDNLPVLQNKVFDTSTSAKSSPVGNMHLVQDHRNGLIYNLAFKEELLTYDACYQNEQACSTIFQKHLEDVLALIKLHFANYSLIEVGCGKGNFLNLLRKEGFNVTGIDPAYEGNDPDILKTPFSSSLKLAGDGIILRHVLEHIQNPFCFLQELAHANGGKGKIYIEVPCFDWICKRNAWFDIYYEHVNYFRVDDFQRIFERVDAIGHLFNGQYLFVIADLAALKESNKQPEIVQLPTEFFRGIEESKRIANSSLAPKAIWGASSKGVIFSLYAKQANIDLAVAIDINPAKQKKYLACSGLKVVSPDEALCILPHDSLIFVMNSNYFDEIVELSQSKFKLIRID